ncbi:hypothetical protein IWQ60_000199 [Tieghemiomyces parasiticus]|uniref:RGS domain-containing protein n=1 Tax=Tieghemiomyces parasiticus TaxID=78921 RepID=A0A9W8AM73_9FUNG|nr:hypothetical protein IWQ60_000199 [Tieghemiomyces parasiticus]
MTNYTGLIPQSDTPYWIPDARGNELIAIIVGTLTAVILAIVVVTSVLFYLRSKRSRNLQQRSIRLTTIHSFAVFGYILVAGSSNTRQNIGYPCFVQLWGSYVFLLIHSFTFIAKILRFLFVVQYNKDKLEIKPQNAAPSSKDATTVTMTGDPRRSTSTAPLHRDGLQDRLVDSVATRQGFFNRWLSRNKNYFRSERRIMRLIFVLTALVMIYVLVVQILDPGFRIVPTEMLCYFVWEFGLILAIIIANSFVVFPFLLAKLWHIKDGYGIRQELIMCCVMFSSTSIITIIWGLVPGPHSNVLSAMSWTSVSFFAVHYGMVIQPLIQSYTSPEVRYSFVGDNDGKEVARLPPAQISQWRSFLNMLSDPVGLAQLKLWASQCFCTELLVFIEEYQDLKRFLANTYPPPPRPGHLATGADTIPYPEDSPRRGSSSHSMALSGDLSEYAVPLTPMSPAKPLGAGSPSELKPFNEKYTFVDVESSAEIVHGIRETWLLAPSEPSTGQFSASRTSLSTSHAPPSGQLDIMSHPSLQLTYYMFYQRFIENSSDLKVHVAPDASGIVEARVLMGDFGADMFDEVRKEVLKAVFNDVFLKCMK